jgi:hypothetical protein
MLPYLLYKLQLLNVSCCLLLKVAYSSKIKGLIRYYINYITKLEFLLAFKAAFYKVFTASNIYLEFRATRLVLFNLDAILLELNIVVYTLLLPTLLEPT